MLNPIEKFKVAILHMKRHQIDCVVLLPPALAGNRSDPFCVSVWVCGTYIVTCVVQKTWAYVGTSWHHMTSYNVVMECKTRGDASIVGRFQHLVNSHWCRDRSTIDRLG